MKIKKLIALCMAMLLTLTLLSACGGTAGEISFFRPDSEAQKLSALRAAPMQQEESEPPAEPGQTDDETGITENEPEEEIIEEEPIIPLPALPKEGSPSERAASMGLPEPPDVDVTSWEFILCNSFNSIYDYYPPYGKYLGQGFDERVIPYVDELMNAAAEAGITMYISMSFRNAELIKNYFLYFVFNVYETGYETAKHYLGMGLNDHQTGLSICITENLRYRGNYDLTLWDEEAKESEAYDWLLEHCAEFGFILRYPEGKEYYYGTACPGAHFRYVGREAAEYIMANGLCLEEFLSLYTYVYVPENR